MTKNTIEIFDKYAFHYQEKFMEMDLYFDTFDFLCSSINKLNPEILEVACGPGNITKYLQTKRPDFNIIGTDLAPKMLELAKKNIPTANFKLLDCRDIIKLNQNFDAIVCGFCLPYLPKEDTERFIEDSYKILNPQGVLYLSTMEGNYSDSGYKPPSSGEEKGAYTHYYTREFLIKMLQNTGFETLKIIKKKYPEPSTDTKNDIILIAQKL